MASIVQGTDVLQAWCNGAQLLSQTPDHAICNLITEVDDPILCNPEWYRRFDPKSVGADDRLSVVAKVLFPGLPRRQGEARPAYYDRCTTMLQRALNQKRLHSSWGSTYFQRLVSLDGSENQIERAIRVLTTWQVRAEASIVAHTSCPRIDGLRKRGSPCLQYVEVLWGRNGVLDLVAVYRNHDFLNKALGNFLGLGRLLQFIAAESGKTPGRLVCHSIHAYSPNIGKLRALMAK
jgi:thymidylate synthase